MTENGVSVSYAPTPSGNRGDTVADIDPFASATELLAALRAGRVTSRDLTELYIRRIERRARRIADRAQGVLQRRDPRDEVRRAGVEGLRPLDFYCGRVVRDYVTHGGVR